MVTNVDGVLQRCVNGFSPPGDCKATKFSVWDAEVDSPLGAQEEQFALEIQVSPSVFRKWSKT